LHLQRERPSNVSKTLGCAERESVTDFIVSDQHAHDGFKFSKIKINSGISQIIIINRMFLLISHRAKVKITPHEYMGNRILILDQCLQNK